MNVSEYADIRLGKGIAMLKDCPIDSVCGILCKDIIDDTYRLMRAVDDNFGHQGTTLCHPVGNHCRDKLIEVATHLCQVIFCG